MAAISDVPKTGFRLSMLIYDTRYRSITIQIVVLVLFLAGVFWLVDNLIRNLAALGRGIDFRFLGDPSGYDINQRLIEYTSQNTHARAWAVGLLNTLLVAVLGCILATVLGIVAGVARLSKNWVVARLMDVYVEMFRNVPLLLWILIVYVVFTEAMPQPRAFGGDNPTASMVLWDSVAFTNRYIAIPGPVFERDLGVVSLGFVTIGVNTLLVIGVLVASLLAIRVLRRRATRIQEATGVRPVTWWQSLLILVVPLTVLKLWLGIHLEYPALRGFNFQGGILMNNSFFALWIALSLYTSAFIAEIVRAGILSVSRGQTEAAFALGLRPNRTMSLVILPQALRVIIPPLISQYLNLTKNSSLAIAIGYMDLVATLGGITLNQTGRGLEAILLVMLTYLVISLIISGVMNAYNRSVQLKER
ncbi:MAG: ABC transporter permease subunit [Rhodobacteraceae bacterium]|jgi:general L-amino acid transport system permease protein|nr:ABC transporter permease subunit [Paracoccaceae bacterium]